MSWESQGAKGRVAVSTSASMTNLNSVWLEYLSENFKRNESILNPQGMRGTRTQASENNVRGPRAPAGSIRFPLTRVVLDNLLPSMLGGSESSDVFSPTETLTGIYMMVEKLTSVYLASEVFVDRWTLSGSSGGLCELSLDLEAEDFEGGQTFPAASAAFRPDVSGVFQMADTSTITLNSVARNFLAFTITGDNRLTKGDFTQGLTRDGTISPEDRIVTASFDLLAKTGNYDLIGSDPTGEAVSLVLTQSVTGDEVTIDLGRLAYVDPVAELTSKGRQILRVSGPVRGVGHPGVAGHVPDIKFTNVAA